MRVPVQRYLILWLCLFLFGSASTSAAIYVPYQTGYSLYITDLNAFCESEVAPKIADPSKFVGCNISLDTDFNPSTWRYVASHNKSLFVTAEYDVEATCYGCSNFTVRVFELDASADPSQQCTTEETFNPETGGCDCVSPNYNDPDTGDCVALEAPEQCQELGKLYDPTTESCVLECEHGMFNGSCLLPPEENTDCNKDSPDYRGEVVLGYGTSPIPACGDFDQCSGDTPGQVGFVNGELRCIPEDYGIPSCQGDSITVIDEYGFVCEPLSDVPQEPETPEEPNTDTDGDGTPDEYQRENDPESVDKGLDKVQDGISDTNTKLDGTNKRLDKVGKALEGVNDNLKDGLGTANQTLNSINDTLDNAFNAPEGGFSSEGLNVIPTLTETATGFKQAIMGNELIQAVGGLAEIPAQTSCPVWTVPSTPISDPQTITVHCDILEDNRGVFSLLFMFFWTGVALFAFLRA